MNRTAKSLAALTVGATVLAVTALAMLRHARHPADVVPPTPAVAQAPAGSPPVPERNTEAPVAPEAAPVNIPPLPANAVAVPDEDLLRLSASVGLANAPERSIDKARWAQVVPVAEKLVQGPCDCEQRNWLNHFIAMGQAANAGENDQYYELAGLMVKLARSDKQLADDPTRSLR